MAGTYDSHLVRDLDWVRFYIRDTASPWRFEDETISAMLTVAHNKWFVAAELIRLTAARVTDDSVKTKIVDDLHLTFGGGASFSNLNDYADWLLQKGAAELMPRSKLFQVLR